MSYARDVAWIDVFGRLVGSGSLGRLPIEVANPSYMTIQLLWVRCSGKAAVICNAVLVGPAYCILYVGCRHRLKSIRILLLPYLTLIRLSN